MFQVLMPVNPVNDLCFAGLYIKLPGCIQLPEPAGLLYIKLINSVYGSY